MSAPSASLAPPPAPPTRPRPRRPGRPATYVFDKPDHLLTDKERKHKIAIEKRRIRQNRSYHRRKKQRNAHKQLASPTSPQVVPQTQRPVTPPTLIPDFSQNPLDLLSASNPPPSLTVSSAASAPHTHTIDAFSSLLSFPSSSSSSAVAARQTPLPPLDAVDHIDATISSPAVSLPSFTFESSSLERPATVPEEDHELATDKLVSSALAVAKSYARETVNLKHAVDQETDLRRMTGIKSIVFDNLRSKYLTMNATAQYAVRHFVIFPRTFNLRAATAVAGLDEDNLVSMQGMLDTLMNANFIITSKGRYELNDAARLFLNEDATVFNHNAANDTYDVAQNRFIQHYRNQLSRLQDDNIHRVGWVREEAMALYDSERENMEFSEFLLSGRNEQLREFLTAGITVMRYCVSAANRERVLRKALMDDETSTEDVFLPIGTGSTSSSATAHTPSRASSTSKSTSCDKNNKARLQLALSEAYFDQLKTDQAEKPLRHALTLMGDLTPNCGTPASAIVDSVLVLLLLSNLRLSKNRIRDARVLCVKALRILADAGLGRSTFGINAMSNLVTIYLSEGLLDKAKSVANKLLDTLNTMRYTGMPIYADALGVCAMVSMAAQNYSEAERQYGTALETVGKWGSKDWSGIPVQHCLDLDLWLMEGLATAIRRQGRIQEAVALEQRAAEDRKIRGLPKHIVVPDSMRLSSMDTSNPTQTMTESSPSVLRHLY